MPNDEKSASPKRHSVQDLLAMELARDQNAVNLLAEQVLTEARKTVFRELRGIAIVFASVLSILGISTWWSIDDKVKTQVTTAVSEALKERGAEIQKGQNELFSKLGGLQQQAIAIQDQATETRDLLDQAKKGTALLNNESEKALEEIRAELTIVRAESTKTQSYLVRIRAGPPSDRAPDLTEVRRFFGELPERAYAIAGSTIDGVATDSGGGGAFTNALLRAMDEGTDMDGDGSLSLAELATTCQLFIPAPQKPVFGGNDMPLLAVKGTTALETTGRKLHALLVGVQSVDPKAFAGWAGELLSPEMDVARIKRQFEDNKRVLATDVSVTVLLTKQATRSRIIENVKEIGAKASKDDVVVFFYSGHGGVHDVNSGKLGKTILAYDGQIDVTEIVTLLQTTNAYRLVLIIDA
jgi:hypothetical protein